MEYIQRFKCRITDPQVRGAITQVLGQISAKAPDDFSRLRERLTGFQWLPRNTERDESGTLGEILVDVRAQDTKKRRAELTRLARQQGVHPDLIDRYVDELVSSRFIAPCKVALNRRLAHEDTATLVATLAHELGHVATTEEDFEKRDRVLPDSGWASEACADYYAYRWGFARAIRHVAASRNIGHHGGLPGDVIEIDLGASIGMCKYRVTRRFYYRPISGGSSDRA